MSFKLPYSNQTNWGALVLAGPPGGPTVIGQAFGGGFYAGQLSTTGTGVADYYLIVAPKSTGQSSSLRAKNFNTDTPGTDSTIDGPTNSLICHNTGQSPAASFCENLTIGGYTDWYWPAVYELELVYYNLKPTTTANVTGGNPYSVPPRGAYTTTNPAQTSVSDFQSGGVQAMDAANYWTSTQVNAGLWSNYVKDFNDGNGTAASTKSQLRPVRAVRRIPV